MFLDLDKRVIHLFSARNIFTAPSSGNETRIKETAPAQKSGFHNTEEEMANLLHHAFEPATPTEGKLVPIPDQGEQKMFFSKPNAKGESSIWLDPDKWQLTLEEVADFASKVGGKDIRLEVVSHDSSSHANPTYEYVELSPIKFESQDRYLSTSQTIGLNVLGHATILGRPRTDKRGRDIRPLYNLGYLNCKTATQKCNAIIQHRPVKSPAV